MFLGGDCARPIQEELHWTLDVAFREDANKTGAGQAGASLGLFRWVAASLLEQDPGKGSGAKLDDDDEYRLRILQGFDED